MGSNKHPIYWSVTPRPELSGQEGLGGDSGEEPASADLPQLAGDVGLTRSDLAILTQALPMLELVLRHGRRQVKFYESHLPLSRASYFRLKSECVRAGWIRQSPCRRFIEPVPLEIRAALRHAFPMVMGAAERTAFGVDRDEGAP